MNDAPETESRSRFTADDRLRLPHGACLALRQSGGLRFSTREVVVYDDGHVIMRWQGKLDSGERSRRITSAEMAHLQAQIDQSDLFGLHQPIGHQNPDGYAYELIVQAGDQTTSIEFFDGSIPPQIQPLLVQLKALSQIADTQE